MYFKMVNSFRRSFGFMSYLYFTRMMMRLPVLFLTVLLTFFACNDVNLDSAEQENISMENQEWRLVRMTGNLINSETTGEDMAWQEAYSLSEEGEFTKVRQVDGKSITAVGTYQVVQLSDGSYFEFTYREYSEIIGNCTGDLKELLSFRNNALFGTWLACDGPGLEYQRD